MLADVRHRSGRATSTARPTPASATRTRCRRSRPSSRPTAARATFTVVDPGHAPPTRRSTPGSADFAITFTAWEGIEAGCAASSCDFAFTDYGFPDFYQVVLACDGSWLDARAGRWPGAFVARDGPRLRARRRRPGRRRRAADRREPGRLRREPGAARSRASGSSPTGGYLRRRRAARSDARRSSSGRATRASCSSRACWPTPTASR